jgi:hypothetical protein
MGGMRLSALLAAALALGPAAASASTREDGQIWININAIGSAKGRLMYYAELQPRFFDGGGQIGQVLARGALGWKIAPTVTLFQGYAHIAEPNDALARDRNEERSFQQLLWQLPRTGRGVTFLNRTRFEQRWRSDGKDVGLRLRSLFRYTHPLGKNPKGLAALVSVEPFVALNDTDWGVRSGLDQVRTNVALEIPLTGRNTMEVGYLNQTINRPAGVWDVNHVAQLQLVFRR